MRAGAAQRSSIRHRAQNGFKNIIIVGDCQSNYHTQRKRLFHIVYRDRHKYIPFGTKQISLHVCGTMQLLFCALLCIALCKRARSQGTTSTSWNCLFMTRCWMKYMKRRRCVIVPYYCMHCFNYLPTLWLPCLTCKLIESARNVPLSLFKKG